jgi:PEP-CTERM motif
MIKKLTFLSILFGVMVTPAAQGLVLLNRDWNGNIGGAPTSVGGTTQQDVASVFAPAADWTVNSITWSGIWTIPIAATRDFTIEIFADSSGTPASTAFYVESVTGSSTFNSSSGSFGVWDFTASLGTSAFLSSGSNYYFSITDDAGGGSTGMFWAPSDDGDPLFFRGGDTGTWNQSSNNVTFSLIGELSAVPEPASLVLLLLGLFGISARRKV